MSVKRFGLMTNEERAAASEEELREAFRLEHEDPETGDYLHFASDMRFEGYSVEKPVWQRVKEMEEEDREKAHDDQRRILGS